MKNKEVMDAAITARKESYSPYSGFSVGAAVLDENGNIHLGCNIENAAYTGSHAEYSAISAMIMSGGRKIKVLAVCADGPGAVSPCGGCRQHVSEFADKDTIVIMFHENGDIVETTMESLLPYAFNCEDLPKQ